MKYISERLGHSFIIVTLDIYGHCFSDDSRTQIEKALTNLDKRLYKKIMRLFLFFWIPLLVKGLHLFLLNQEIGERRI